MCMKDFSMGNKIYALRRTEKLSQNELANLLGISNKAVSKWENGDSSPSLDQLVNLSKIFNVTIEELIGDKYKRPAKSIHKIVLTGGPCSGKSTAMSWLQTEFAKKGYLVLFVPETASELIVGGVAPWNIDTNQDFETLILKHQLNKEKLFEEAAKCVENYDKVLIVCDRGCLDCKAYMTEKEFNQAMQILNCDETQLRDSYEAVFHLVTAANGAEEFYTQENNPARLEGIEEAIEKDNAALNAWVGHPHLRVIDNSTNFESKMRRLMLEISNFLGENEPYEIERKFLVEYPNLNLLERLPNCKKVEIIQTYLLSNSNEEMRIRQRGSNSTFTYTKTIKKSVSDIKRIEREKRITKDEYLNLLMNADPSKKSIRKTRYCLMYKNQYFEIDIYPNWKDKAIMEIELRNEQQDFKVPNFIKVIKEVSGDENYSNYHLANIKD